VDKDKVAGDHQITWDGLNDAGQRVSSGVYYYALITKDARLVRKMTLVR
jgi:flagellar hook assembly protein FlgD